MCRNIALTSVFILMFAPLVAVGHAQLLIAPAPDDTDAASFNSPLPREDNVRMKDILPCGGFRGEQPASVKGPVKRIYQSGSTVRVHWKETNDHAGVWRIDLSADNEKTWQVLLNMKDGTDEGDMSEATPRFYWADIQLPAGLQCESCTFRLTQSMGDIDDDNDYFSCADITIK